MAEYIVALEVSVSVKFDTARLSCPAGGDSFPVPLRKFQNPERKLDRYAFQSHVEALPKEY